LGLVSNLNIITVIYNQWVNVLFKENKGFWQEEHIKNYGYYYQLEKEINKPQIYPNGSTGKWYKILLEFKILNIITSGWNIKGEKLVL